MKKDVSVIFTGDIGFDRYMDRRWRDDDLLSAELLDFFRSADHVCANVEGAMIRVDDAGSRDAYFHAMDPEAASFLERIRADIWCIGNNHIMDAGREGLESTLALARGIGCRAIGAGLDDTAASEPIYLEGAGGVGMFGVVYMGNCEPADADRPGVFRWDDMERIAHRIAEVKAKCRWCIVVAHGGEEFACLPNPYTRDRYLRYLELGADAVVAHHPHVPENYETFEDGKAIFYSLGNFVFDTDYQRAHRYTDTGVLLKLVFSPEEMRFEAIGTRIVRGEERIERASLPMIFADVPAEEYELLAPLAAKAFIAEDRRKMIYLHPEIYENASEEVWNRYYFSTDPDGYCRGSHMDLSIVRPFAQTAELGAWKRSRLEAVKEYIRSLL